MRVQICEYESRKDGGEEKGKTAKSEWDIASDDRYLKETMNEIDEMEKKMPLLLM